MEREQIGKEAYPFDGDAYEQEREVASKKSGIGTLGERSLHAILKQYLEPVETKHEIKVGRFVADIVNEDGITEIQTRAFDKLRRKLDAFLDVSDVTVVYPIARMKYLQWLDEETGEITSRRKSPKKGKIYDVMPELYKIKWYLADERFHLKLLLLDLEETRLLNGWSKDKKKGSHRFDRVPLEISTKAENEVIELKTVADYKIFLPIDLPKHFTTKDLKVYAKISQRIAQITLHILHHIGVIERVGKLGNMHLYQKRDLGKDSVSGSSFSG